MVISSKLRRQITDSNLFLSVWASSARTGLTGMGDRSDPSWLFWAPQHLNHSLFSPPSPSPFPCPARLMPELSPLILTPNPRAQKPPLHLIPRPRTEKSAWGSFISLIPSLGCCDSSSPRGKASLKVFGLIWIDLLF